MSKDSQMVSERQVSGIDKSTVRIQTLRSIRSGLVQTIIPNLSKGDATTVGHIVLRLVDHLLALDLEQGPAYADAEAMKSEVVTRVTDDSAASRTFLREFVDAEVKRMIARDPEAAGGVIQMYLGGRTSRAEDEATGGDAPSLLTLESLTQYMRRRFPDRSGLTVHALDLLPGGMSKQTIKVRASERGADASFVIRKDFPISPSLVGAVDEFPMLRAMWHTGSVPMAEPLWAEQDSSIFGTPLIAVSLVEGSTDYSGALHDPEQARIFAEALAKAMARLHATPLQQTTAGPLIERMPHEHVAAEIDRWHSKLRLSKTAPDPVIEGAFAWLRVNIPQQRAPSAIVHGDIGFHNMLMKDGDLKALLDWEFAHIGDPAEDVIYARFFVEQVIDWRTFIDLYVSHGGTAPTPEQEHFYAVWQSARNAAGCAGAEHAFLTREGADMKLGVSGMTFQPRFAIDALQRIANRI